MPQKNAAVNIIAAGVIIFGLYVFQSFLRPFIIALLITFLISPMLRIRKKKIALMWGITSVLVVLALVISGAVFSLLEAKQQDIALTTDQMEQQAFANQQISILGMEIDLGALLQSDKVKAATQKILSTTASGIGTFISEFFTVLLFLLFMLPGHGTLIRKIGDSLSSERRKRFLHTVSRIEDGIGDYLRIKTQVSLLTGVLSGIILAIFGFPYPIVFGLLTFLFNYIPSIGSFIALAGTALVHIALVGISTPGIIMFVLLLVVQFLIGNILEPKLSGKKLELSPVIILLSLFFWGYLWGVVGMFLSVPLTVSIKIVLEHLPSTKKFSVYLS